MAKKLNILLVEPANAQIITGGGGTPPLWPCILKGLTPPGHHVDFIHTSFEEVFPSTLRKYDLVGISVKTATANHAYAIGDMCKGLGITCIMGGIHTYFRPDEALEHCDCVVLGEAECLWGQVVEDVVSNELQTSYRCEHEKKHDLPDLDIADAGNYKYNIVNSIETVRGCPFGCAFCSATEYSGRKFRYKSIDRIIREVDRWKRPSSFALFADLNVVSNQDRAKEMFAALSRHRLMWWGSADVKVADDEDLLELMAKSGCSHISVGMESISDTGLRAINKAHNTKRDFKEIVRRLHDHNIDVFGNFIFGLDSDTKDTFAATVDFAINAGIDFPIFQILVPYPGTKLYDQFEQEGRLRTQDWSRYTRSDVVFEPQHLTPDELINGTFWAYEEIYSRRQVARRALNRWRGVKRGIYDAKIVSHFSQQIRSLERHHGYAHAS